MPSDVEDTGDHQECPHCGESWDTLMHQPALEEAGHNPKSGDLYNCRACGQRVTQDEIETGKQTHRLIKEGYYEDNER